MILRIGIRRMVVQVPPCVCNDDLEETENRIMSKLSTLADSLTALETKLTKIGTEIEKLKEELEDVELPAPAQEALDRLAALAEHLDELNPDAEPEPPPTP